MTKDDNGRRERRFIPLPRGGGGEPALRPQFGICFECPWVWGGIDEGGPVAAATDHTTTTGHATASREGP